jgi:hypothetical protein
MAGLARFAADRSGIDCRHTGQPRHRQARAEKSGKASQQGFQLAV